MSSIIINPYAYATGGFPIVVEGENLDAETGDTTGWTATTGTMSASTTQVRNGTYSFYNGGGSFQAYNDIQIPSGVDTTDIDNSLIQVEVDAYTYGTTLNTTHSSHVWADFYNGDPGGSGTLISSGEQTSRWRSWIRNAWKPTSNGYVAVPANSRWIRLYWNTSGNPWYMDDCVVRFHKKESIACTLSNPALESGSTTGWTGMGGVDDGTIYTGVTNKEGTYFAYEAISSSSSTRRWTQAFALPTTDGWSTSIDDGVVSLGVDSLVAHGGNSLVGSHIDWQFWDGDPSGSGVSTGTSNDGNERSHNSTGHQQEFNRRYHRNVNVPTGTRWATLGQWISSSGGSGNVGYADDYNVNLWRDV